MGKKNQRESGGLEDYWKGRIEEDGLGRLRKPEGKGGIA